MSTPPGHACDECGARFDQGCAIGCEGVAEPVDAQYRASVCVDCMLATEGVLEDPAAWSGREKWEHALDGCTLAVIVTDEEPWFSWAPCDTCRSPLGGDRWPLLIEWQVEASA